MHARQEVHQVSRALAKSALFNHDLHGGDGGEHFLRWWISNNTAAAGQKIFSHWDFLLNTAYICRRLSLTRKIVRLFSFLFFHSSTLSPNDFITGISHREKKRIRVYASCKDGIDDSCLARSVLFYSCNLSLSITENCRANVKYSMRSRYDLWIVFTRLSMLFYGTPLERWKFSYQSRIHIFTIIKR